jgi:hypothetical protein
MDDLVTIQRMFEMTDDKGQQRALRTIARTIFDEVFPAVPSVMLARRLPSVAPHTYSMLDGTDLRKLFTMEEMEQWVDNKKIGVIKLVKSRTGMNLMDAKHYVEDHLKFIPYSGQTTF